MVSAYHGLVLRPSRDGRKHVVAFDPAPRTRGQSGLSLLLPMPTQCLHDRLRQLNGVLVVRLGLGQPVLAVLTPDPYPFEGAAQLELSSTEVDVVPLQAKYLPSRMPTINARTKSASSLCASARRRRLYPSTRQSKTPARATRGDRRIVRFFGF